MVYYGYRSRKYFSYKDCFHNLAHVSTALHAYVIAGFNLRKNMMVCSPAQKVHQDIFFLDLPSLPEYKNTSGLEWLSLSGNDDRIGETMKQAGKDVLADFFRLVVANFRGALLISVSGSETVE